MELLGEGQYKEGQYKEEYQMRMLIRKSPKRKVPIVLPSTMFRSYSQGKHSNSKKLQSLVTQGNNLFHIDIPISGMVTDHTI